MSESGDRLLSTAPVQRGAGISGVSQRALDQASLFKHHSEETLRALAALLEQSLADPTPGERRDGRFGLLTRMIFRQGEIPGIHQYEAERKRLGELGEDWPSAESLVNAYFTWSAAVDAAIRHLQHVSGPGVPSRYKDNHGRGELRQHDVLQAVVQFQRDHGEWPEEEEFFKWNGLQRQAAWLKDPSSPARFPDRKHVKKFYGSFGELLSAGLDYWQEIHSPYEPPAAGESKRRARRKKRVDRTT